MSMIGVVRNESLAGKIIQGGWERSEALRGVGYSVIESHKYKCSSCGTQSVKSAKHRSGMMIPVDTSHSGLAATKASGATCLCPLCASALAINWSVVKHVGSNDELMSAGFLIYLPFQSQSDVSRLAVFTLACLQKPNSHPFFSVATDIDAVMGGLAEEVSRKIPIYNGSNADFAKALALVPDEYYEQREQIIGSLRWWPNMAYWADFGKYIHKTSFSVFEKSFNLEDELALFTG